MLKTKLITFLKVGGIGNKFFLFLIYIYRLVLKPLISSGRRTCRFEPTCSEYSAQSFRTFSCTKALYLTVLRLLKCQPFGPFGYDPIPLQNTEKHS